MIVKSFRLALATTALVALAGASVAQDKSGQNMDMAAAPGESVVSSLALAQQMYAWGKANRSALVVAGAAKMAGSVNLKDEPLTPESKPTEGADTTEDGEGADAPVGIDQMIADARDLAAGDDAMLAMIEDIAAESTRGQIGGGRRTLSRLRAGYTDYYKIPFYGGRYAEMVILGDGDADLDLLVTDENGNTMCLDTSYSDQLICSFTPAWDGYFYVAVKNQGRIRNSYFLITN